MSNKLQGDPEMIPHTQPLNNSRNFSQNCTKISEN